jgi:hypothetical protein
MNDFVFSIISRGTAVAAGALAVGWFKMGFDAFGWGMIALGIFDPHWIEWIMRKKKGKKNGQTKKRSAKNA